LGSELSTTTTREKAAEDRGPAKEKVARALSRKGLSKMKKGGKTGTRFKNGESKAKRTCGTSGGEGRK